MGADVDGLAYCLHHHTVCSTQMRGQSILTGVAPSHRATVGGGTFPGGCEALRAGYLTWC
jgi:hypothetical protein